MVYKLLLYLIISVFGLCQIWLVGDPSSWLLYPCDTPLIVWSISLFSGIKKCSRLVQLSGSVKLWASTSGGHVLSDSHP